MEILNKNIPLVESVFILKIEYCSTLSYIIFDLMSSISDLVRRLDVLQPMGLAFDPHGQYLVVQVVGGAIM